MVVDEFQVWSDIDLHKIKEISRWIKRENVFTVNSSAHSQNATKCVNRDISAKM